jgi:hypothetical protein
MAASRRTSAFLWDAAGPDRALATASVDLRAGMTATTRDLLATTRGERDFARRAYASAVLGSAAANLNAAELWTAEQDKDPDAWLLWARVAAVRALRAGDREHPRTLDLVQIAVRSCLNAAAMWEADPTPQVVLLSLDRLRYRAPVTAPAVLGIDAPGPWDQLQQIAKRDPHHREAAHHLLAYFYPRHGGDPRPLRKIARWFAEHAAPGSPLRLLPLYAELEHGPDTQPSEPDEGHEHRVSTLRAVLREIEEGSYPGGPEEVVRRREQFTRALTQELSPDREKISRSRSLARLAEEVFAHWFGRDRAVPYVPVRDLSVLVHALYAGGSTARASAVLEYLGPHASTYPWALAGDDPEDELTHVYAACHVPLPRARTG